MNGCPGYLLYLLVERLAGKATLDLFVRTLYSKLMGLPLPRQVSERNLRRIIFHIRGREPAPAELEALLAAKARLMARDNLSKYEALRDPAGFQTPVDLELLPTLQGLLRGGRGAVLVTPHFGDTTMLFFGLARTGIPLNVMVNYAPPAAIKTLAESGLRFRLTDLSTGARHHIDALARNELILLISDMDFFPGGRTLDFFGAPFNPPHGPTRLALAAGAPILPVYSVWDGARHHLLCDAPIPVEGMEQEALERSILRSMERFIGRHPDQWLLLHDPWDLEAGRRETSRQLRRILLRRRIEDIWSRLTSGLRRARI